MVGVQGRRLLLNGLMLLLVAGLAGLAWWWQTAGNKAASVDRLLALDLSGVNTVEVDRNPATPGKDILRFQKEGSGWQMQLPKVLAANPVRMRQVLTLLEERVEASYDAADKDLQPYGLNPGQVVVRFNGEALVLGGNNPVSNRRYVLHDGKIKLVNEAVFGALTGEWLDFVALKLVPEGVSLQSVQLPAGFVSSPALVTAWQQAEAIRLEPLEATVSAEGKGRIQLISADGTRELRVLETSDELVLADVQHGLRYIFPISQMGGLLPSKTNLEPAAE